LAGSEDKKTCAEGVMLLEKAFKAQTPTPDQMLLLATAYKRNAEWRKASNYMIDLLGRHAKHEKYPRYLTVYVDWLSTEEPGEAPIWMSRLTEIWQGAQTNPQQLAMTTALLTDLLRRHPRLVQEVRLEANFLRAAAGKKEQLLVYAQFFGQIKQTDTALDLCEQALKETEPLQAIDVAVSVLGSNSADAKQFARVEAWLQGARQQNPKLIDWDVNLAILKERQASYAEAEALYRSVLKRDADHLVASNNLAFLVGLQDKGGEAIVLIEKLISKHGPLDELLDTRACILGSQGRLADAEADLRRALKNENSPYRRFHLAQVLLAMKKTPDAVREFQAAIQRGLNVDMLHPLERESFQRLKRLAYP
jgi:tetratricopeptide (TPR) repeat protein